MGRDDRRATYHSWAFGTNRRLDHILLVDPNLARVDLWSHKPDRTWSHAVVEGLDEPVPLPGIGITLAMADIHDGVVFPAPGLRLVRRDQAGEPPA